MLVRLAPLSTGQQDQLAVISTILIALFWTSVSGSWVGGPKSNALIANIGILLAVLWGHWPAPLTRVP